VASHSPLTGLRGYRAALLRRPYRRLWVASLVSRAGDAIQFTALPLFAYAATGSPVAVASVVFVEGCGLIAGALLAQFVVDRQPPRRLLVALDCIRALTVLTLAAVPTYGMAVAVSLILAITTACFTPLSSAVVPRLVDDDSLPAANALQWTAGVLPQLVGAPLGGLLVALASARIAFALNAVTFAISAVLLLRLPPLPPLAAVMGPWCQMRDALRAARRVPILPPLLAMQALAAGSVGATSALLVVLAERDYDLGAAGYGAWLTAIGVGALLGPLVMPMVVRFSPRDTVAAAYVVRGASDVALGALNQAALGAMFLGVYGLNTSSGMVAYQTLVQRAAPEHLRGRAFAVLDVVWQTARLASIAAGGLLALRFGARPVFVLGGLLLVTAGLVGALWFGRMGSL
jgi:predicted MFS family arabinose efflux permease